jgi:hypothetical protein
MKILREAIVIMGFVIIGAMIVAFFGTLYYVGG